MPQRYEPVQSHDDDESPVISASNHALPSSPPPSFRSRASSPTSRHVFSQDPLDNEAEQTLADTFDDGEGSDREDEEVDDRQRLMRASADSPSPSLDAQPTTNEYRPAPQIVRRVTEFPGVSVSSRSLQSANDGVFANLSAKPERGEKLEEQPPSYEQAAADATPPYWETTIVAPGMGSDEVYVDGLPVGSVFSFIWNGMISMSFQLVGFLLTYLLHTTHAAKNGSRAGLGLTLVQYGFYMKGSGTSGGSDSADPSQFAGAPTDPNAHDFNPNTVTSKTASSSGSSGGDSSSGGLSSLASSEWLSYVLMIVGWFILIRAVSDYLRARRHEQLVLQSPNRGLPIPVVAEGETAETVA
ncbi:putative metal homeostatis protein bsd2 [Phaeomoniella chlamydospora]|uniref:Putative metal homeostatis protein bsd2 n=1 Tax=Phaeomoniella chlamydospora TaxID=158046 RepID=A0A0G2FUS2_PHACM|nr:putative metal homeostatis protein bsd2 [Phaeomoniella chlamydospora]